MTSRALLSAGLRLLELDTVAAELDAATTIANERAALEAALNFIWGYQRALSRHERALRHTAAAHETKSLQALEVEMLRRLQELSAQHHLEGRAANG